MSVRYVKECATPFLLLLSWLTDDWLQLLTCLRLGDHTDPLAQTFTWHLIPLTYLSSCLLTGHVVSAVNLKGIWPRRAPADHATGGLGGLGAFYLFVCLFVCLFIYLFLNLAEAAASAASMQFTALVVIMLSYQEMSEQIIAALYGIVFVSLSTRHY